MTKAKWSSCAALAAFAALAVACSGIQQGIQAGKDAVNLQLIGQTYKSYCTTNKKGPANADDLMKSANTQQDKDAVQLIKDGHFDAVWNVNVNEPTAGGSGAVLVWTKTPTNNVRVALMADTTTVNTYQEADFQKQPKAKPGTGGKDK
jgi:hypothetical protein